jgi:putative transposase
MRSIEFVPWQDQRTPALAIVARGDQIRSISPTCYEVRSQSRPERKYAISVRKERWACSCAFHRSSRRACIHILAIRYRTKLGDPPVEGTESRECLRCGSHRVIRFGRRYNRRGIATRYRCKDCGTRFTNRAGVPPLRHDLRIVAVALDLYFRGLSLRKVADHLEQAYGVPVAPATIYAWIARFTPRVTKWMDSLGARTGSRWHMDETLVKVDGNPRWVWNIVDAATRFLMATHVTRLRRVRDAQHPMRHAKTTTPDRPLELLTDGLPAYRTASGRELAFRSGSEVVNPHVRVPSIRAKKSNNLVERLHGTEKERIKVLRGFHGANGPKLVMEGFRAHYNMVRPHSALGTTPAVAAGLPDLGGFRWNEMLKQATRPIPPRQAEIVLVVNG